MEIATILILCFGAQVGAATAKYTNDALLKLHGSFMTEEQLIKLQSQLQAGGSRHLQGISETIDDLFENRVDIDRTVENIEDGVVATTTSSNPAVAVLIKTHVTDMKNLESPVRQGDPFFVALFENIEDISLDVTYIDDGVRVTHIGATDCARELTRDHAAQVSYWLETGDRRPNFGYVEPAECDNPQVQPVTSSPTASNNNK